MAVFSVGREQHKLPHAAFGLEGFKPLAWVFGAEPLVVFGVDPQGGDAGSAAIVGKHAFKACGATRLLRLCERVTSATACKIDGGHYARWVFGSYRDRRGATK